MVLRKPYFEGFLALEQAHCKFQLFEGKRNLRDFVSFWQGFLYFYFQVATVLLFELEFQLFLVCYIRQEQFIAFHSVSRVNDLLYQFGFREIEFTEILLFSAAKQVNIL